MCIFTCELFVLCLHNHSSVFLLSYTVDFHKKIYPYTLTFLCKNLRVKRNIGRFHFVLHDSSVIETLRILRKSAGRKLCVNIIVGWYKSWNRMIYWSLFYNTDALSEILYHTSSERIQQGYGMICVGKRKLKYAHGHKWRIFSTLNC